MIKFYAKSLTIFFFCFLILSTCTSKKASAEEAEKKEVEKTFELSGQIKVTAPYVSEYTGEYVSNGALVQPSVTLTHNPSGIYVSVLGYETRRFDEVDLYLGKVTEWKGMTFDTGVGIYNVEDLNDTDGDLWAIYAGVDFPEVIGVIPFAYIEADFPFHKELAEGGVLWKVGAKKSVGEKQPVEIKVEVGGNDGIYGSEPKLVSFARGTASTEVTVLGMKFAPSLALQKGFGGIAGQEWRGIFGLTLMF